jgi:hypothetical protein
MLIEGTLFKTKMAEACVAEAQGVDIEVQQISNAVSFSV